MRSDRVQHRALRQIERAVVILEAREAARHHRAAVIAAPPRDDLLLRGPPQHVVVVPDDFQLRFVGVRTRETELHTLHAPGRHGEHALGQPDGRLARIAAERVVVRKIERLRVDRVRDFRPAIADVVAIDAGERVDELAPFAIVDANAMSARDDPRYARFAGRELLQHREWMQEARAITLLQGGGAGIGAVRVGVRAHGSKCSG
jgi:hypothetical protein